MKNSAKLLGISNAIVDVLSHVEHNFLDRISAAPGSMTLIDEQRAHEIYSMMGSTEEMSGGSVANSVAGFANLGGSAAYIGRLNDDQLGETFTSDMQSLNVDMRLQPAPASSPTARCYILITDDGQRTMQTYLGACTELRANDITEDKLSGSDVVLLEGYLWDLAEGPQIGSTAAGIAKQNGSRIALSLSDSLCVDRHKLAFQSTVKNDADIILGDEDEFTALLDVKDFDHAVQKLQASAVYNDKIFAITRGEKGSVILHNNESIVQQATRVDNIVDTTGAGDAYTAGFLYGLLYRDSLKEAAEIGTRCATAVISQVGARVEKGAIKG